MNLLHRIAAVSLMTAALAGCKNMGLQELQTQERARYAGVSPLVKQVSAIHAPRPLQVVRLGGHNWIASRAVYQFPDAALRPVGGMAGGVRFYRMAWDEAPYDRVFAHRPHGFVEYSALY